MQAQKGKREEEGRRVALPAAATASLLFLLHSSSLPPSLSFFTSSLSSILLRLLRFFFVSFVCSFVRSFIRRTATATVVVVLSSVSIAAIEPHHLLALPVSQIHSHLALHLPSLHTLPCAAASVAAPSTRKLTPLRVSHLAHATLPSSLSGSFLPPRSFNSHLEGHGKGNWCRNRSNFRGGRGYQQVTGMGFR